MDRTISFKANRNFRRSDAPMQRTDYSFNAIMHYINECTSQIGNDIHIDASKLEEKFFPTPHRMIFISHRSKNIKAAHEVKTLIETACPKFSCFIDSDVWANIHYILTVLHSNYAYNNDGTYDYESCNNITKHLCLILSMALIKAIKDSIYFLYIPDEEERNLDIRSVVTDSPWVCQELLTASLLQEPLKLLCENDGLIKNAAINLQFRYTADSEHLHTSSLANFINYINRH